MLDGLRRPRPRPDRVVAEGRSGRQRSPAQPRRGAGVQPRQQLGRRLPAGLRPPGRRQRHPPDRRRRRPHRRRRLGRRRHPTGAMVAHPTTPYPNLDVLTGRLDEVSRARAQPLPRQRGAGHRAVRRRHDGQHPAARRRRAAGGDRRRPGAHRAGDRAQRRRRRPQRRRLPLGTPLGGVTRRGRPAPPASPRPSRPETLDELVDRLAGDLVGYQSERYAARFRRARRRGPARPSSASTRRAPAFTEAVARHGHKLMAYKDEYEVARLLLAPEAARRLRGRRRAGHEGHVAAAPADAAGARACSSKMRLGPRTRPMLAALAGCQAAAGHARRPVPLGRGAPRQERAMVPEYERAVDAAGAAPHRGEPGRGRRHRLAARPGPRLRAPQAAPGRRATATSSPTASPDSLSAEDRSAILSIVRTGARSGRGGGAGRRRARRRRCRLRCAGRRGRPRWRRRCAAATCRTACWPRRRR